MILLFNKHEEEWPLCLSLQLLCFSIRFFLLLLFCLIYCSNIIIIIMMELCSDISSRFFFLLCLLLECFVFFFFLYYCTMMSYWWWSFYTCNIILQICVWSINDELEQSLGDLLFTMYVYLRYLNYETLFLIIEISPIFVTVYFTHLTEHRNF